MFNYSADKVDITWLGLDFGEGIADGTFITDTRANQSFTMTPLARGKIVRTFNPQKHGTLTILVNQSSALHQQLLAIAAADRDPDQRDKVGNMKVSEVGIALTSLVPWKRSHSRGSSGTRRSSLNRRQRPPTS
jgi:hypothetical protein